MHVVICGGGVIGACTGYFLARRGIDVTVVERSEVASSASGKAGGFLALDWCAGSPLDTLARRSFALHASFSKEIDGDWGYQRMTAYSGLVVSERDKRRHVAADLNWLSDGVIIEARLSHLAYAPEIASAMLRRQQANAIIAARQRIVEGAVGMVENALAMISERSLVHLDDERKAAMISNLLVVLCSDRDAQPIVNTGSIYQ